VKSVVKKFPIRGQPRIIEIFTCVLRGGEMAGPMKITAIETHVCHARMRNWVFVKVLTDQAGLWGWGEATLEWHTRAVVGAIEDISPLLIGEEIKKHPFAQETILRTFHKDGAAGDW
jgi:L-alanine-DL-glutamate epimerase-like enolase superfamily enzyme